MKIFQNYKYINEILTIYKAGLTWDDEAIYEVLNFVELIDSQRRIN